MSFERRVLSIVALLGVVLMAAPGYAQESDGTYYKDVLPIVQDNCQTCHRDAAYNISGAVAPMSLMTYEETRPWARAIASKVEAKEMPPWFASAPSGIFENERGLTDAEIRTISAWVDAGAPAGDRAAAPPPKVFAEAANDGWSHGTPDFVVRVAEPYVVPDEAYDINTTLTVEIPDDVLAEEVWVRGWELKTGADDGVHHMCTLLSSPDGDEPAGSAASAVGLGGLLSCVAEGAESGILPDGYGLRVKPGSTLSFSMHFNKEPGPGSGFSSQPEVGFFVETRPVEHEVITDTLGNNGFEIPPNVANYRIGMARTLKKDTMLLNLWPHAHLRAVASRYIAYLPDGTEELLLDVPNYDQGWQVTYKYKEPKLLPKGTRIEVDFWYDNTEARGVRRSFNANRAIGFGPRTNDEMSLGFLSYVELDDKPTTDEN